MINYEGQICRPPMERASFMLPVAVGCAYNRCRFCMLFKHVRHRLLPVEEIEAELLRVQKLGGSPKRVFFGDGNAFGLPTEHLLALMALTKRYFPDCRSFNMDATVTDINGKTDEELRRLREAGAEDLYLGIESGDAGALLLMQKDHTPEQAEAAVGRLREAGLCYNAHIMTGLSGRGKAERAAELTAAFLNRTKPRRIINTSLFLHIDAPLYRDVEAGRFMPASELESLLEEEMLLSRLFPSEAGEGEACLYDGFHEALEVRTRGTLPADREKMLSHLREAIARQREAEERDPSKREPVIWKPMQPREMCEKLVPEPVSAEQ